MPKYHTIRITDEVYDYLKGMIEDEHIANADMDGIMMEDGRIGAHRPTFSEVISHLIEDREAL
jgi:predicted CopG family antitoxin